MDDVLNLFAKLCIFVILNIYADFFLLGFNYCLRKSLGERQVLFSKNKHVDDKGINFRSVSIT